MSVKLLSTSTSTPPTASIISTKPLKSTCPTGFKYTSSGGRLAQWQCRCVCGNERVVVGPALSSGISRGCGCLRASKYYRAFGEGKTLTMWSRDERCPVSYNTLRRRVLVLDWPIEKAISEPPGNRTMSSKT